MARGSFSWRELMDYLDVNRDAFNNDVTARTNVLDLPAHYQYNPERWRLYADGTRLQPEYETTVNDLPQYTHDTDRHILSPAAGETVTLRSAERPRYVVQYELAATFAFQLGQSLQSGDRVRVGLYDGTDGWYLEQTADHADDEADFVTERNGTVVHRESDQDIALPTTTFGRLRLQTGWYNITRQEWHRSYPELSARSGESDKWVQQNDRIATAGMPDARGPRYGNLPIYFEVTASADTTDLTLEAGSAAQVNLGQTTPLLRQKVAVFTDDITETDTWEPIRTLRLRPGIDIINAQVIDIDVGRYTVSDTVEILAVACNPDLVLDGNGDPLTDGDYSTPPEFMRANNVIETSAAVEQAPDETGTPQTSTTTPGGWQLNRAELFVGSGNQPTGTTNVSDGVKRPMYGLDTLVLFARSANTGTVEYQIQTNQDW